MQRELTNDLPKLLRIKARMIIMGEGIEFGSDAKLMADAADAIEAAMKREERLREALTTLVEAKVLKEQYGKCHAYEDVKEKGWKLARGALSNEVPAPNANEYSVPAEKTSK